MKLHWDIEAADAARLKSFVDKQKSSLFVRMRMERNLATTKPEVSPEGFWRALVACVLTSVQRSGPRSPVNTFLCTKPFPLELTACGNGHAVAFMQDTLRRAGGIRFTTRIPNFLNNNLKYLSIPKWHDTKDHLERVRLEQTKESERVAARFLAATYDGIGPKQARNLLQVLRLTRYETPIDSRITEWLNVFGFPMPLSAALLADGGYYEFVADGFQALCEAAGEFPCVVDAAIFSSVDKEAWTEDGAIW